MVHYMYIIFLFLQIGEIRNQRTKHELHPKLRKVKGTTDPWFSDLKWSSYSNSKSVEEHGEDSSSDAETLDDSDGTRSDTTSTSLSSEDTREFKVQRRFHRACTPCPVEMLMGYKNRAIKWICGGYQRARRSFKSDCMMRYRNCQDGTISVSYSVTNVTITTTNGTTTLPTTKKANITIDEVVKSIKTRRKDKSRSTSSESDDSDDKASKEKDHKEDLDMTTSSESSSIENKHQPKKSGERKGWRRWHRKCTPCPEFDIKYKHQSISWICGAYQRARRSFKSPCMMYFRNCQDGTMFVKIHDNRCKNDLYHGEHFFYDYKVELSDENSDDSDSDSSSESSVDSFLPKFKDSDQREINKFIDSDAR